ncbi:MAG: PKD domain-containing protein, partial [Candidatus Tectomicrobia bacterium]|nr:PKD domain-containing protein [Candidatus Tectomicrobia bacterium]
MVSGEARNQQLTVHYYAKQGDHFAAPVALGTLGSATSPARDWLMGMAAGDVNNDGQMDFVVQSDTAQSWLFLRQGNLTFAQATFLATDFERDAGTWGAPKCNTNVARDHTTAHSGTWSMRVFATSTRSCLSLPIFPAGWDLIQGPTLSFAYRIPPGVPVGFYLFLTGVGQIYVTGTATAQAGGVPVLAVAPLIDDNTWRTITIDLYNSIRARWPQATGITRFEWGTNANALAGAQFWFDDFTVTRRTYVSGFQVTPLPSTGGRGRGIDIADVQGDGAADMVRGRCCDGQFSLYRGDSTGQFTTATLFNRGSDPYGVVLADFNEDGKIDLIAHEGSTGQSAFFAGNGNGTFQPGVAIPSLNTSTYASYKAYDFNGDGHQDLVVVIYTARQIWYYPGRGNGTFGAPLLIGTTTDAAMAVATPVGRIPGQPFSVVQVDRTDPAVGETVTFDASGSYDDGSITTYTWVFGDGTTANGAVVTHAFPAEGQYAVVLRVTDNAGKIDRRHVLITVRGQPPVAVLTGPAVADERLASLGQWAVPYDVSASSDDVAIARYVLDWGDGSSTTIGAMRDTFRDGDLTRRPWWTSHGGTWQVTQGQLQQSDTSPGWKWLQDLSTTYQDFVLEVDVQGVGTTDGSIGVVLRNANTSGSTDSFLLASQRSWGVWRVLDFSTGTVLQEGGSGWTPGTWYHLRLVVTGQQIRLYVTPAGGSETLQLTAYSPRYPTGSIGLLANGQQVLYDNVTVTPLGASLTPTHLYSSTGDYRVTLTVTDHAGQQASTALTTRVTANNPPLAHTGGPYVLTEAEAYGGVWTFRLNASGSSDDYEIQRYTINFGDGTTYTTSMSSGESVRPFVVGTNLYGLAIPDSNFAARIIASEDNTHIDLVDLTTQLPVASRTLNRFGTWDVPLPNGLSFSLQATKPIVALASDLRTHTTFIPSLDASPVGHEFLYWHQTNQGFFVYALADTVVRFFDVNGVLLATHSLRADSVWEPSNLSNALYRVVATGPIAMQTTGTTGYTSVPSATGTSVGRRFLYATTRGTTGAFVVLAYQDTTINVFDLESGQLLYTHALAPGDAWFQPNVGTRRLRLESTGDVEVWAGDTAGGTTLAHLGDDLSVSTGRQGQEFYLPSLGDGAIVFATQDQTTLTLDHGARVVSLNRDGFLRLTPADLAPGQSVHHLTASHPVVVQTLGAANGFRDAGTYLGGVSARHRYGTPGVYPLTVTVTDRAGQTHTATTTVTVQVGAPPVPRIAAPAVVDERSAVGGQWAVTFDASGSQDDRGIFAYAWDFGDGTTATSVKPTHHYTRSGTYTVQLTVTDHEGQRRTATTPVVVTGNQPPVARAGGPYVVGEANAKLGLWTVTLDGTGSHDDVGIYSYEWLFPPLITQTFAGTTLDTTRWLVSPGVTQNEVLSITGTGQWGARYFFSTTSVARAPGARFEGQIRPLSTFGDQMAWGFKQSSVIGLSDTHMPYAILFASGRMSIYEDGNLRTTTASTYTAGVLYDLRITLKAQGAIYEFKPATATTWTFLYDSTYSSATPLKVGATVQAG